MSIELRTISVAEFPSAIHLNEVATLRHESGNHGTVLRLTQEDLDQLEVQLIRWQAARDRP